MTIKSLFVSTSILLGCATAAVAQDADVSVALPASLTGKADEAAVAPADSTAAAPQQPTGIQLLEVYGWMTGMRAGLNQLGLTDEELGAFARGLAAARAGVQLNLDMEQISPVISQFIQGKFETTMAKAAADEKTRAEPFWTALKANPAVVILPSGLGYEIIKPGSGKKATAADTVSVNYKGTLVDGEVFDTNEGKPPFEPVLGEMIPAWSEGMQLIGEGGTIRLYVPPELAYGDYGSGMIPPGGTLIFEVELLAVKPTPPAPAAEAAPAAAN